jgi:hypothetical protein
LEYRVFHGNTSIKLNKARRLKQNERREKPGETPFARDALLTAIRNFAIITT